MPGKPVFRGMRAAADAGCTCRRCTGRRRRTSAALGTEHSPLPHVSTPLQALPSLHAGTSTEVHSRSTHASPAQRPDGAQSKSVPQGSRRRCRWRSVRQKPLHAEPGAPLRRAGVTLLAALRRCRRRTRHRTRAVGGALAVARDASPPSSQASAHSLTPLPHASMRQSLRAAVAVDGVAVVALLAARDHAVAAAGRRLDDAVALQPSPLGRVAVVALLGPRDAAVAAAGRRAVGVAAVAVDDVAVVADLVALLRAVAARLDLAAARPRGSVMPFVPPEQPSQLVRLPSSQPSTPVGSPSPQTGAAAAGSRAALPLRVGVRPDRWSGPGSRAACPDRGTAACSCPSPRAAP